MLYRNQERCQCVKYIVKRENVAHMYFSAKASANTLVQINYSARTFHFKINNSNPCTQVNCRRGQLTCFRLKVILHLSTIG